MVFADPPESKGATNEGGSRVPLTRREREILGSLAEGMSGAQIAEQLVLSPETVRTHVRNAMAKLGASTRSQAVALALQQRMITADPEGAALPEPAAESASRSQADQVTALTAMLTGLVSLYDVEGGAVYLAEDDGLGLLRVAEADPGPDGLDLPSDVALGEGTLGRAALERRAQLLQPPGGEGSGRGAVLAAPMIGSGRLVGVIALGARVSRPIGRNELLLLQAFANRVGEVLLAGGDIGRRLDRAMQRFQASWSGSPRVAGKP